MLAFIGNHPFPTLVMAYVVLGATAHAVLATKKLVILYKNTEARKSD